MAETLLITLYPMPTSNFITASLNIRAKHRYELKTQEGFLADIKKV